MEESSLALNNSFIARWVDKSLACLIGVTERRCSVRGTGAIRINRKWNRCCECSSQVGRDPVSAALGIESSRCFKRGRESTPER